MRFVQFRVHPGVGCARMGNSTKAYHLASEFPYFLQEEFPSLRFRPKPRVHPRSFFANETDPSATGVLGAYFIYDATPAFQDKFKEAEGKIFPQAARFRVFAYVYATDKDPAALPRRVFEVTPEHADITWSVTIGNKKSVRKTNDPNPALPIDDTFENVSNASLDTANTALLCQRLRQHANIPNLGYLFLERNDADKSKVTGRLHVIGNEGEVVGKTAQNGLWWNDWYDSAGDGPVTASIRPKAGNALRRDAGAATANQLKFLSYGTEAPLDSGAASVEALPAWVVVGCPDYVPDNGHIVSLWDVGFDRGCNNVDSAAAVPAQPGKHMLVPKGASLEQFRKTDYRIHLHPNLCLFDDLRFLSGEAWGEPELKPAPVRDRAHSKLPPGAVPAPDADLDVTRKNAVEHGGAFVRARAQLADLADPKKLKDADPTKPINDWIKVALFMRMRKPWNVYADRKFIIRPPVGPRKAVKHLFPRKLGRRMDYDGGADQGKMYEFPHQEWHGGEMRRFHTLTDSGQLCGLDKSPPKFGAGGAVLPAADLAKLELIDDMFWPANFADMPMLRELAFTPTQYKQFEAWQAAPTRGDLRRRFSLWDEFVTRGLKRKWAAAGDADQHFAELLAARPKFAPALIDMAHLGAMIGGSFLPGIEVGREGGISTNWCLFYGGTEFFPTVRFKPWDRVAEHTVGTLTKDLAIPWSGDFRACDETFWPTSRPGMTTQDGIVHARWLIGVTATIPHLGRKATDRAELVKEYWKALGFIRRDAVDMPIETERTWVPP